MGNSLASGWSLVCTGKSCTRAGRGRRWAWLCCVFDELRQDHGRLFVFLSSLSTQKIKGQHAKVATFHTVHCCAKHVLPQTLTPTSRYTAAYLKCQWCGIIKMKGWLSSTVWQPTHAQMWATNDYFRRVPFVVPCPNSLPWFENLLPIYGRY